MALLILLYMLFVFLKQEKKSLISKIGPDSTVTMSMKASLCLKEKMRNSKSPH